jgi:hypothetical protein
MRTERDRAGMLECDLEQVNYAAYIKVIRLQGQLEESRRALVEIGPTLLAGDQRSSPQESEVLEAMAARASNAEKQVEDLNVRLQRLRGENDTLRWTQQVKDDMADTYRVSELSKTPPQERRDVFAPQAR